MSAPEQAPVWTPPDVLCSSCRRPHPNVRTWMRRKGTPHACGHKYCGDCRTFLEAEVRDFDARAAAAKEIKDAARYERGKVLSAERLAKSQRVVARLEKKLDGLTSCALCGGKDLLCMRCQLRREALARPPLSATEIAEGARELQADTASARAMKDAELARRERLSVLGRAVIVGLVACSAEKAAGVWPAHLKYTSALFRKSLAVARQQCDEIYVLSGMHHVVALDQPIGDYDVNVGKMLRDEQSRWSATVRMGLRRLFSGVDAVELRVFGGKDYANAAYEAATGQLGWTVSEPLAGLEIGQRLRALNDVLEPNFFFLTTPAGASAP